MTLVKALIALSACATTGLAVADTPATPEGGLWVKRQYKMQYMGFTSTYSCDGLADKLKVLVKAAGARDDIKASPGACSSGFGTPDKFASASVTFYALIPSAAATAQDAGGAKDQGIWQTVEISSRKPRELQGGDCELVEQFRDHVLPLFATRNVEDRVTCVPNQLSGSSYFLRFEVLTPVKAKQP